MDVETALAVEGLGRRAVGPAEGEVEIEDRMDIGIEPIIALAGEGPMIQAQIGDGGLGVDVKVSFSRNAFTGRQVAVVVLVVEGGHQTLIVWRNYAAPQNSALAGPIVEARDAIALAQVLVGIEAANVVSGLAVDEAKERLQDGVRGSAPRSER